MLAKLASCMEADQLSDFKSAPILKLLLSRQLSLFMRLVRVEIASVLRGFSKDFASQCEQ